MPDIDTYRENIKHFKAILASNANNLLSNEKLVVIYIGRETCPFCRKFVEKLNNLVNKIDTTIYYINSENSLDNEVRLFREKYNIKTVPGFLVKKNEKIEIRCDSSMLEYEILNMIK